MHHIAPLRVIPLGRGHRADIGLRPFAHQQRCPVLLRIDQKMYFARFRLTEQVLGGADGNIDNNRIDFTFSEDQQFRRVNRYRKQLGAGFRQINFKKNIEKGLGRKVRLQLPRRIDLYFHPQFARHRHIPAYHLYIRRRLDTVHNCRWMKINIDLSIPNLHRNMGRLDHNRIFKCVSASGT